MENYLKLLKPETTIYEVKYMMFFATGLTPNMQRILHAATCRCRGPHAASSAALDDVLGDDVRTLASYKVRDACKLILLEHVSPEFQELQAQIAAKNPGAGGGTGRHSESLDYDGIEVEVPLEPAVYLAKAREQRELDAAPPVVEEKQQPQEQPLEENENAIVANQ